MTELNTTELKLSSVDRVSEIDKKQFHNAYLKPLRPLVIEDLAKTWPAYKKWSPEFFQHTFGDKQVKVYDESFVAAGDNYMSNVRTIPLRDYIDVVLGEDGDLRMFLYNIKSEIPELVEDIVFPELIDSISRNFVFMFFGCKGSVTQMHFDIDMSHVLHASFHGKKTVYLFPYEQGNNLYRYPFTCRSYVDIERPDYEHYPKLQDAEGYVVDLNPGETLFIPSGYWHHFVYDEAAYAVSLRCSNQTVTGKLHGLYNLLVMQSVDRLMNKMFPETWFDWKQHQALGTR